MSEIEIRGEQTMMPSLCDTCKNMREVRTARSRFLLCQLSATNAAFPKYPPQPVLRCCGYQCQEKPTKRRPEERIA